MGELFLGGWPPLEKGILIQLCEHPGEKGFPQ